LRVRKRTRSLVMSLCPVKAAAFGIATKSNVTDPDSVCGRPVESLLEILVKVRKWIVTSNDAEQLPRPKRLGGEGGGGRGFALLKTPE